MVIGSLHLAKLPRYVQAKAVQEWITAVGAKTAYITTGSPWENGYVESFNARLRDELLDGESSTRCQVEIVIESWRRHFNRSDRMNRSATSRRHRSFVPAVAAWPAALRRPAPPATLAQGPTLN